MARGDFLYLRVKEDVACIGGKDMKGIGMGKEEGSLRRVHK
jgi:hypothetical protein